MAAYLLTVKLIPGLVLALALVVGLAEVFDSAVVAAAASILNTWLIVRNDRRSRELREEVHHLKRQLRERRHHTRMSDRDVVVITPEDIADVAEWAGRDAP